MTAQPTGIIALAQMSVTFDGDLVECPACRGARELGSFECPFCGGDGIVTHGDTPAIRDFIARHNVHDNFDGLVFAAAVMAGSLP